jgi:hypothetical protein
VRSGPPSQTEAKLLAAARKRCALLLAGGLIAGLICVAGAAGARAEDENHSIFTRFDSEHAAPEAWQTMAEFPFYLRPQLDPGAEIVQNRGVDLVISFRPRNRVYFSRGYGFSQMEWLPSSGSVEKVQLTTMEISEILNVSLKREVILSFGLGIGLMSGLIRFDDGGLRSRLEPFLPIQFGLGFYPVGPVMLELKLWHAFFLGPGPVVSATRGLIGVGYNF